MPPRPPRELDDTQHRLVADRFLDPGEDFCPDEEKDEAVAGAARAGGAPSILRPG